MLPPEHKYHVTRVKEALRRTQVQNKLDSTVIILYNVGIDTAEWPSDETVHGRDFLFDLAGTSESIECPDRILLSSIATKTFDITEFMTHLR